MKNYRLIEEKQIEEVASLCRVYRHEKTGAQILTLENKDENKAFGIGFRTPPKKGDGVAHIVEHCVLSGSRKYRTREPFMDLIKASMQTFLNAMTYPDKTIYPVSSRNKKDFYHLMDVYLDAVFYPRMYEKKEIFLQEGWHYEMEDADAPLTYNGVVYNEMKGVYSSAENIVSDGITFSLHEQSSYGVDSGGDPQVIPTLSYEEFLDFHRKYYHPSNSYIYLYGDMDMEEALGYIDREYLCHFEQKKVDSEILLNEPFTERREAEITFSASKEEMGENKDYLALAWCLGTSENKLDVFMRSLLSELLIDAEAAPLKRALLDAQLGEDVYAETSTSKTLDLSLLVKNTDVKKAEQFINIVEDTLKKIVQEGIDRDLLMATLNRFEFSFREGGGTQKAIIYYARALNSWLYDKSPLEALSYDDTIAYIREHIDEGFVEQYVEEKLLNNNYSLLLRATPQLNKNKQQEEELQEKLAQYKASLSKEEQQAIMDEHKALVEFQMTEDDAEAKATIPSLELSDIKPGVTRYEVREQKVGDNTFLTLPQATNGIAYLYIAHDLSHLTKEELPIVGLLSSLIGKVDTQNYSYEVLNNEIYKATGGIGVSATAHPAPTDSQHFFPRMLLSIKALVPQMKRGLELAEEIIHRSDFSDKKRVKEILFMVKSSIESTMLQSAHAITMEVVKSYYSPFSDYMQQMNGLESYFYLKELLANFDERWETFSAQLQEVYGKIFLRENAVGSLTTEEKELEQILPMCAEYMATLCPAHWEKADYPFAPQRKNQAFYTTSNVNYVSKGYSLSLLNERYKGSLTVLSNVLNSSYLHYHIRAKGGAYGGGITMGRTGDVATYSYRDPNLKNTVEIYDGMGKAVSQLEMTSEELKDYIIGSMNSFDPLLTPDLIGSLALARYITGSSYELLERQKQEALSTTVEELRSYGSLLEELMKQNYICVIGNEEDIRENGSLFHDIISLK